MNTVPEPYRGPLSLNHREQCGRAAPMKICFMASGGGHFQQMCELACLGEVYDHFLISTTANKAAATACPFRRIYMVGEVGQGMWKRHPGRLIRVLWEILRVFTRERPDVVVSTGSGIAIPGFIAARLLRISTIYVEAYARAYSLSLTGKICYHLSDRFLVQHRALLRPLPRAVYAGTLYSHLNGDEHGLRDNR